VREDGRGGLSRVFKSRKLVARQKTGTLASCGCCATSTWSRRSPQEAYLCFFAAIPTNIASLYSIQIQHVDSELSLAAIPSSLIEHMRTRSRMAYLFNEITPATTNALHFFVLCCHTLPCLTGPVLSAITSSTPRIPSAYSASFNSHRAG
jgi:hypothetical protein